MKTFLPRLWTAALTGAALLTPLAVRPLALRAENRKVYHDNERNDDHQWNSHEDKAYRMWEKENHHKHVDFAKAKEDDQKAYWAWRHDHSDDKLKIH